MSTKRFSFSKGLMSIFVALLLVVTLFACNRDNTEELIAEALDNLSIVFESGDSINSVTQNLNLPTKVGDVTITWSSNNPTVISNQGVVTRGFADVNVVLTATATLNDKTDTKPFTVKVIGHDAVAALNSIVLAGTNIAYNTTTQVYTVTGNITLPQTANGLAITWESLLPAVLSTAGVVVRPVYGEENANVILIAKIGTEEREFNILVPAITAKPVSVILAEARTALLIPGVSDGVSQNITLPTTVTRPEGAVAVTWSSSNPDVISNTGIVNRQEDQVNVTLTATLTYQSQSVTKEFDLVVLPSVSYVVAENIADAIAMSKDGTSYTRTYVRINAVTVLGITGDGVVLMDDSGFIFVYMGSRISTVVIGGVYDVRGTTDRYFGAWQLNHTAISGQPVVFTDSTEDAYVPTPVVVGSITEMLANHWIPTTENPDVVYGYYRLTTKVRVQNAADNYGTVLVNPDYVGGDIPTAANSIHTEDGVVIYYHSNRTAVHPYDGLVVTLNIFFYGYRDDRRVFNTLYLGTVEDVTTTLDDAGILNVVETTLRGQIAADYIEPTTISLPTSLLGSTIAWTSSHDNLINPNTGVVTLPTTGQTEVTLTAVLTRGDATKTITIKVNVGELEISTIAQALALPLTTKVRIIGVVTGLIANNTFAIQDSTGAIAVFTANTATTTTWLTYVGKTVELIGTRGAFGGLEQINPLLVTVGDVTPMPFPVNIDGIPLTATDLLPHQAKHVIRTNLVVESLPAQSFGNVLAVLKDPVTNETINFFWDSRIIVAGGNIGTLQVGDVISLIGVPLTWTSNVPRFAYTNASQIYMGIYVDLDDEGKAQAAADALIVPLEVQANITLTLPATGQFDTTIVWTSSDNAVINPTTGVVTLPTTGNVTITLTATVTLNDAEFVKEFDIVVGEIVKTVAAARELKLNDIITVEGVVTVTAIGTNVSAFIQDETGGINIFISVATQAQKDAFALGNKVLITGKIAFFNNQIQIATPTKVEQISTGNPVVPVVVDDIEDLVLHEGKLVTITVLLKDAGGVRSTNIIDLTGEIVAYFNTNGDQAVLNGIAAGTWVTITGPVGRRFENIQLLVYSQAAVTVGVLGTDAELGAVAATKFVAPEANNAVIADLTLPVAGLFGTVVTWTSSNPAVISNAGVVTRPASTEADATVTLSYELKKGDYLAASGDVVFVVLKQEATNGGDPVPVTVTASYTGGTTNMAASPANNAALIGLDPALFTVTSLIGSASVEVGLNTAGQIRIYANRTNGNGNTLTITAAAGYKITAVEFVFGASTTSPTATLTLGAQEVLLTPAELLNVTKTYTDLDITSFAIKNTFTSGGTTNAQIYILQIIITYVAE
jgi:uncharacterized protein YdeI (BOF family)